MVPSASAARRRVLCTRPLGAIAAAGVAAAGLCGCVSTQTKNARLVLQNERTLAMESSVRVTRTNPDVAVAQVATVRAAGGSAVVVTLRNRSSRPLSDLPIAVRLRLRAGGRTHVSQLNGGANLAYFDTHLASIPAHGTTIWVLDTRRLPPGARPVVKVGLATVPATTRARFLPRLRVRALASGHAGELSVSVRDLSGVPQYGLPVYAVALRGGRPVGAATASVSTLAPGARTTVHLRLPDSASGALELSAPATIFN